MNIIVYGVGKIGSALVASFVSEGHDVVVIDNNEEVLSDIANMYDVMTVCGNGADCTVFEEAGMDKTDLFIAVTGSDELNMLCCFLAHRMGAKHTVSRIRNPEYNDKNLGFIRQQLGLSLAINPELWVAQEIFNILKFPSADKIEYFSRRNFEMVEVRIDDDSELNGMTLMRLKDKFKAKFLIGAVQRGEEVFIPDGNFELKSGDKIGITGAPVEIHKLLRSLGMLRKQAKNIMIVGGGKTTYYLAKMLDTIGASPKIIEIDQEKCRELSTLLPKSVIIHGDGTKQELLLEEDINDIDAFVSLTGMDEENILVSIFAFMQTVPTVISKINRDELYSLAGRIGLESLISPKDTTTNVLLSYARAIQNSEGSNVETLYKLMDGKAEALEFKAVDDERLTEIPFKELKIKKNILIAGIIRNRKTIIPSGDDMIMAGDRVVVLSSGHRLNDLSDILK